MCSRLLTVFLYAFIVSGCTNEFVEVDELQRYCINNDNGLIKTILHDNVSISLLYRPTDLLILHEVKSTRNNQSLTDIRTKYEEYTYFVLRVSKNNEEILNEFARRNESYSAALDYFSGHIKDDITLSFGAETKTPIQVSLTQSFGIAHYTDVMIVFHTKGLEKIKDSIVSIRNSEFISRFCEFSFKAKDIRCVPTLNPLSYENI